MIRECLYLLGKDAKRLNNYCFPMSHSNRFQGDFFSGDVFRVDKCIICLIPALFIKHAVKQFEKKTKHGHIRVIRCTSS